MLTRDVIVMTIIIITSVHLRKLDVDTHKTSLREITN